MKYNLLTEIKDYDGSLVMNDKDGEEVPLTIQKAIYVSLNNSPSDVSKKLTEEEMVKADALCLRAYENPTECEISTEEAAFIIQRAKLLYLTALIPLTLSRFFNEK